MCYAISAVHLQRHKTLIAIGAGTVSAGYSQYLFRLAHGALYHMTKASGCVTLSLSSRESGCRQ